MGSCFSVAATESTVDSQSTSKVVTANGCLKEYSTPVSVRQVLGSDTVSCFLCNADSLNYNENISALDLTEMVQLGQLYFILPIEKLRSTLSSEDMATLAVKDSLVISSPTKSRQRVNSIFQVMPMTEDDELEDYKRINEFSVSNLSAKVARKKMGSSVPLNLFRERLSTIVEVSRF
ncbi:uncharacterized protein A4U43_C05F15980 [Asparagus officinalis]|uniref:Uncharacterized protein n=1 Tax=Asparagus officinalis TaxID=4686 RepID=A0A5P1ES58_ASPOF|nr:uncharacterized protein LOC109841967 [Asparagus officinalis]ONK68786.1 uncharacterized protein A4U43_C05F15980 [Asparagus officinalis]